VLIIPSSLGSQLGGHPARINLIFWRRCQGKEDFCKGSFASTSFTLFIVLLYFIFTCIIFIKNTKKISILYSCYFSTLSSLCCSLSLFWRTSQ
jgi:hypothetical protein